MAAKSQIASPSSTVRRLDGRRLLRRFATRAGGPATAVATAPSATADDATPIAPAGGSPWVRYAAIVAIIVVLILLYTHGYR